jgi:hypothetical protein
VYVCVRTCVAGQDAHQASTGVCVFVCLCGWVCMCMKVGACACMSALGWLDRTLTRLAQVWECLYLSHRLKNCKGTDWQIANTILSQTAGSP